MVVGSKMFFRSNSNSFTFHDHAFFIEGNKHRSLAQPHSREQYHVRIPSENLMSNMPLVLTNRLFKSPSGLIFECSRIVRAVPSEINETEVHLDFHIFAILEFDLLIGHLLDNLSQEKSSHGSLKKETAFATPNPHPEFPMAKHLPNHDEFEEVKFVTPFVSPSPSLDHKPCPFGHHNIVLDGGRDSTLILNVISLESKNFYTMDILFSPTCPYEDPHSQTFQEDGC